MKGVQFPAGDFRISSLRLSVGSRIGIFSCSIPYRTHSVHRLNLRIHVRCKLSANPFGKEALLIVNAQVTLSLGRFAPNVSRSVVRIRGTSLFLTLPFSIDEEQNTRVRHWTSLAPSTHVFIVKQHQGSHLLPMYVCYVALPQNKQMDANTRSE